MRFCCLWVLRFLAHGALSASTILVLLVPKDVSAQGGATSAIVG